MKKYVITISLIFMVVVTAFGQTTNDLLSSCAMSSGADAKYLKDFRVQLGKASVQGDLRFKANMSLWRNTKYRFSMCNTNDSKGLLILNIRDEVNHVILSSFDQKSGKTYPYVEFTCNKSGIYQLNYDFTDQQQGSGLGVVSIIK